MLPPEMLKRWVFPWHKKIVEAIHKAGKHAILHSCGQVKDVMEDIIDYIPDENYLAMISSVEKIIPTGQ